MSKTLKERIVRHIEMTGPLPVAEYMHWCLADSEAGYYTNAQVLGREGDFVTAPEVSQMFGELIGVWAIQAWQNMGAPDLFNLVELGPGRGTLMKDLLRACNSVPEFIKAAKIHLVETSDRLSDVQKQTLHGTENVYWCKSLADVPQGASILIANEFLDALPFRQYVKQDGKWLERAVGLDESDQLVWNLSSSMLETEFLPKKHKEEPDGSVFEISNTREAYVSDISTRLSDSGGTALLIDYGHSKSGFGDTFQALSSHAYADPLAEPGKTDLTSHVDFEPLRKIAMAHDLHVSEIIAQGEFLLSLGLLERAGALGAGQSEAVQAGLVKDAERLALPDQMGELFKVMTISSELMT